MDSAIILAILLRLPVCYADREDPRKQEQLTTISAAIATVSADSPDKAAKLVSVAYNETRLCLRVHSGEHQGRGRGLYQLEGQSRRYPGPFVGLDYESTLNATRVASAILDHSFQCGYRPADVFTAYGARPCGSEWKTLSDRVRVYQWAYWRFVK